MSEDKVKIEIINGCEGKCIVINNHRIAGSKPWGGGHIETTFEVDKAEILEVLKRLDK